MPFERMVSTVEDLDAWGTADRQGSLDQVSPEIAES